MARLHDAQRADQPVRLRVDIWSDVVCPWCYIGKRRFDAALALVAGEIDVDVVYRPFQLDPTSRADHPTPVVEAYARKFGGPQRAAEIIAHLTETAAADGLRFRMDVAVRANTFDAHRLLWLAAATGHQVALKERLMRAYFVEGANVGDRDVLAACAGDVGMSGGGVRALLDSDDGTAEVRAELAEATELGITAVPTYVFGGTWAVPGAQDAETFAQVLRRLAAKQLARTAAASSAAALDD